MPESQTLEPEVVAAVQKEIKALGDNVKKNFDELNKGYETLKQLVEQNEGKFDTLVKAQIQKWSEDIVTRQEALDDKNASFETAMKEAEEKAKAAVERMDQLELAFKERGKKADEKTMAPEIKDAMDLAIAQRVVSGGKEAKSGVTHQAAQKIEINLDEYKQYCEALKTFLRTDERMLHSIAPDAQKALSVGIDPDGGYTVTPTMSNRIIKRLFELDPMRALATVETITTNAIEWLVDYDEAGGGWEAETESGAETGTPQIFKKRIPVHVLYAKPRATQTLIEDSAINIEGWLSDKQANRFLRIESAAFVSGDGIGKPRGFLTYSNYDTAGTDQWGRIERQNIGNPITADGLYDLKFRLIEQYLMRGTWLMNRLCVVDVLQLKDGAGRYIWSPGLREDEYSMLLGLPVRMSTTMPIQAANSLSVAIADWREAYMIVDRLGISVQRDPYTVKPYIEFYTRKRVGGDVVNYQAIKIGVVA